MRNFFLDLGRVARIFFAALLGAVPILGLFLSNRPVLNLSLRFAVYELTDDYRFLSCIAVWVFTLWGLPWLLGFFVSGRSPAAVAIRELWGRLLWPRIGLSAAALYFCLSVYMPLRYGIFAEFHCPLRALEDIHRQNLAAAYETCQTFINLYPRKAPSSTTKDFTCGAVYELIRVMGPLYTYVDATVPKPRQIDGLSLPVGIESRRRALKLLKLMSGTE